MIKSDVLRPVFSTEACKKPFFENGYYCFLLREKGKLARLKRVKIIGVPKDAILIKPDCADPLNDLLGEDDYMKKRCDYILICSHGKHNYITFFELKSYSSGRIEEKEVKAQFKGGKALIDYIESLIFNFLGLEDCFKDFKRRCILFYAPKMGKRGSNHSFLHPHKNEINPFFYDYANPQNPPLSELIQP